MRGWKVSWITCLGVSFCLVGGGPRGVYVGPPFLGAHAAGASVVGVEFGLRAKSGFECLVDLSGGDGVAGETRGARGKGVLLGDGELGGEEGAKGVKAEE